MHIFTTPGSRSAVCGTLAVVAVVLFGMAPAPRAAGPERSCRVSCALLAHAGTATQRPAVEETLAVAVVQVHGMMKSRSGAT